MERDPPLTRKCQGLCLLGRKFTIPKSPSRFSSLNLRNGLLLLVVVSFCILLASAPARTATPSTGSSLAHAAGAQPAGGIVGQPSSLIPKYDEQLGMTFPEAFSELSYNVTAVAQSDAQGFGPGYLLNGLTNVGYWYQVGVAFDWPYQKGGYDVGFNFLYEAFNSSGASIYPSGGGGGLDNFSGTVNNGDLLLLQLSFSNEQVSFRAHDWSTGADANQSFPAFGSKFVGLGSSSGANGFFSGLMTEWYHVNPYYGSEAEATYSNSSTRLSSATLWVDEFNVNSSRSLFGSSRTYAFSNPDQLRPFSLDGATEYANAYSFITGSLSKTQITLSYSVAGGGTGFGTPQLSYIENGTVQTATLSMTPATFLADSGSVWQVSGSLPGSSSTERWETPQVTNETLTTSISESVVYFHQYLCALVYTLAGDGSGHPPPQWSVTSFGSPKSLSGNASAWADAGTSLLYPQVLAGSTSSERWATQNSNLTISGPEIAHVTYYHQVALNVVYLVSGGKAPTGPRINATSFGSPFSQTFPNSTAFFLDGGTTWSLSPLLPGSGAEERWFASGGTAGNATLPRSVTVVYQHQYALTVDVDPIAGGSVTLPSTWAVAGSSVQFYENPQIGWKFEGWTGSGNGSYTGPLSAATVVISGPVTENATFYPGLEIDVGPNGAVVYTSLTANGTVPAGRSAIVYVPVGSAFKLRAVPSSAFFVFAGWSPSAGGAPLSLTVGSPETVTAHFDLNPLTLVIGATVLAAAVALALLSIMRGRKLAATPPDFNAPV